ncbi:MAG: UvrD-helicase domain-containing protein [Thermodesulfobacteriota bacterium]
MIISRIPMDFIADFHIHSHYSRATARDLVPERLSHWAQKKGISLLGTGDFTHPGWVRELREKLVEAEEGSFRLRPELERDVEREVPRLCRSYTRFVLTGEISCIYKRDGKTRKVHHLILMPGFEALERLNRRLSRIGNITSDGRPILGLDSRDLLEIVLEASDKAFFIPAHIWTPWFSLFGSKSGFDAIEECFGDLTSHIHALETGLSSDPPMNRRLSAIERYSLVSNSDAHSPAKLGREANLFGCPLDYPGVVEAMSTGQGFLGTVEFFPEEGKYHLDGHRKCGVRLDPQETRDRAGLCPKCGKPLTVGVLSRVYDLADRNSPVLTKEFRSLIPLAEILSEILSCGPATSKVLSAYEELLETLGPELRILMDCPSEEIQRAGGMLLAEAIRRMRRNDVIREEGYDGEYGIIRLFREGERDILAGQGSLFGTPAGKRVVRKRASSAEKPSSTSTASAQPMQQADHSPDPVLDPLNPEQREVVLHGTGHLLVVAGPGTGKTMALAHRIAHLIRSQAARSDQILALTFTNKAAREMKERVGRMCRAGGETQNRREGETGNRGTGESDSGRVKVSTFHGFCIEVLRKHGDLVGLPPDFILCSETDSVALARQVVSEGGGKKRAGRAFLKAIPGLKAASVMGDLDDAAYAGMLPYFREYQQRLRSLGMLDLDDLEVETLRLLQEHPDVAAGLAEGAPWLFVDEYQDTNPVQVEILKAIVGAGSSSPCTLHPAPCTVYLCAIGDPDQAIYGFRGADVRSFLRFDKDFPGASTVRLLRNYRSTQAILEGAAAILQKTEALQGQGGPGKPLRIAQCRTAAEEAEMIVAEVERFMGGISYFSLDSGRAASHEERGGHAFGDVAVLIRLNAQGEALEEAFRRAGIPYVRSGEKPLTRRHPVHVLWRFLLALRHPEVPYYKDAYLALPELKERNADSMLSRGLPAGSLREIVEHAVALHAFDLATEGEESLRRLMALAGGFQGDLGAFLDMLSLDRAIDHEILLGDRVALMSLHAAKGLEWPVVFIAGCEEGLLPCTLFGDRDEEEEKRLFYVGMTRARHHLVLSHAARRTLNGRPLEGAPSPFLKLIPKELVAPLERGTQKRRKSASRQLGLFR